MFTNLDPIQYYSSQASPYELQDGCIESVAGHLFCFRTVEQSKVDDFLKALKSPGNLLRVCL